MRAGTTPPLPASSGAILLRGPPDPKPLELTIMENQLIAASGRKQYLYSWETDNPDWMPVPVPDQQGRYESPFSFYGPVVAWRLVTMSETTPHNENPHGCNPKCKHCFKRTEQCTQDNRTQCDCHTQSDQSKPPRLVS